MSHAHWCPGGHLLMKPSTMRVVAVPSLRVGHSSSRIWRTKNCQTRRWLVLRCLRLCLHHITRKLSTTQWPQCIPIKTVIPLSFFRQGYDAVGGLSPLSFFRQGYGHRSCPLWGKPPPARRPTPQGSLSLSLSPLFRADSNLGS